jgi:hypothetical protein
LSCRAKVETSRDGILKAASRDGKPGLALSRIVAASTLLRPAQNDRVEQETFIEDLKAQ